MAAFAALPVAPDPAETNEAMRLCTENKTEVIWVSKGAPRFYAAGPAAQEPERVLIRFR